MEKYKLNLGVLSNETIVTIKRKKIKNIHLKVDRELRVTLSVPMGIADEAIVDLLNNRTEWISKQLFMYKQSSGYNNLGNIKSGSSSQLLGKDRRIKIISSLSDSIEEDEKYIVIYMKKVNEDIAQKMLATWWRDKAKLIYLNEMGTLYDKIFSRYDIEKPSLQIRKMQTLWGSCTPSKGKITLNEYLLKADLRCIQYVVLHELTHLIHPYHNNDFYNFLTVQMPDWKIRKKQLDKEVVQGL